MENMTLSNENSSPSVYLQWQQEKNTTPSSIASVFSPLAKLLTRALVRSAAGVRFLAAPVLSSDRFIRRTIATTTTATRHSSTLRVRGIPTGSQLTWDTPLVLWCRDGDLRLDLAMTQRLEVSGHSAPYLATTCSNWVVQRPRKLNRKSSADLRK